MNSEKESAVMVTRDRPVSMELACVIGSHTDQPFLGNFSFTTTAFHKYAIEIEPPARTLADISKTFVVRNPCPHCGKQVAIRCDQSVDYSVAVERDGYLAFKRREMTDVPSKAAVIITTLLVAVVIGFLIDGDRAGAVRAALVLGLTAVAIGVVVLISLRNAYAKLLAHTSQNPFFHWRGYPLPKGIKPCGGAVQIGIDRVEVLSERKWGRSMHQILIPDPQWRNKVSPFAKVEDGRIVGQFREKIG